MNPDQTASKRTEHSYLVPCCLQYRLHKQLRGVETNVATGGLRVKMCLLLHS